MQGEHMPTLIAAGAFCPLDGLAGAFEASDWHLVEPDIAAHADANGKGVVALVDGGVARLADLLAGVPDARGVILHVSREEALAAAMAEDGDPEIALESWRACALEQVALFRRMRDRVVLVPRRCFESTPEVVLGEAAPPALVDRLRLDPLALAIASGITAQLGQSDRAASLLSACVREEHRAEPPADLHEATQAWRRLSAIAETSETAAETAARLAEENAALARDLAAQRDEAERATRDATTRESAITEEIALLRQQIVLMHAAVEAAHLERDRDNAEAVHGAGEAHAAMLAERDAALEAARAQKMAVEVELAKMREALAARDRTIAERDAALEAAKAKTVTKEAELAEACETLAARDKALAQRVSETAALRERLAAAEAAREEVERLRQVKGAQAEEIGLLREHMLHLQTAFETAWLQREERCASASRQPPVQSGLTVSVDLGSATRPAP